MTKKSLLILIILIFAFVALMLVATFFDLQISVALGNAESVFGQFFNYLGELPAWLGIPVACLILFRASEEHKYKKILKPIFLVCVFIGFFLLADYFMDEMTAELKWKYLYVVLFGLTMGILALLGIKNVKTEVFRKLVVFAIFALAIIALSQAVTEILKLIWARQRFRNLQIGNVFDGTAEGYTPWYKPTFGKHDETALYPDALGDKEYSGAYKSFPSGHTAAAASLFAVIILPEIFEKLKKYKPLFYAVPTAFTVLVAISRIVNRAHFLSDVTVAAFYTVGIVFLIKYILKKIWLKRKLPYYECFCAETAE